MTGCSLGSLFRKAIDGGGFSLPGLVDIVSNIIGVRPVIVFYLKDTRKKVSSDSVVVCLFLVALISA